MASAEILSLAVRAALAASAAICAVVAVRKPLRIAFGAHVSYASWLLVPAAAAASFVPRRVVLPAPLAPASISQAPLFDLSATAAVPLESAPTLAASLPSVSAILFAIWITGALASLAMVIVDHRRMTARLQLRREGSHYRGARDAGPAVVGLIRPRIVIPDGFEQRYDAVEQALVLSHEREHIRAGDAQVNAIAAVAQCLNWFNPLFYFARRLLRVDQELACDERVMRRHAARRRTYAEAMLKTQLSSHAIPLGCHWPALGAKALGERIEMLRRPSPTPLVRSVGALACAAAVTGGSAVAWAAQKPVVVYAEASPATAAGPAHKLGERLVEALQDGDIAEAQLLISMGADVNTYVPGDGTPLTMAAREGNLAVVEQLLKSGADVNRAAPGDGNPLIVAAADGRLDLVRLFVAAGADVNGYVEGDETPLINAAGQNRLSVAQFLISAGADVNLAVNAPTLSGFERRSPLGMARRGGHAEMIQLLREHGAEK